MLGVANGAQKMAGMQRMAFLGFLRTWSVRRDTGGAWKQMLLRSRSFLRARGEGCELSLLRRKHFPFREIVVSELPGEAVAHTRSGWRIPKGFVSLNTE